MTYHQEKTARQKRTICNFIEMLRDPVLARTFADWWNESAGEKGDAVFPFEIDQNCQNIEKQSILDQNLSWIHSLLEQAEARCPERERLILYTTGVIQGFLILLSDSSQMSISQQEQIRNIASMWEKVLRQKSNSVQESGV